MTAAIRAAGARILDNAMLYKDMTQWLRNKTFLVLFFGLLVAAEGLSIFVMALGDGIERPGLRVYDVLFMVLGIYGMVVAFMGHSLTSREFQNRTFELYELSGMSLERMIGGKFLSMVYQFFFGFFCVVPFMFFAYFLGGLDFLDIVSGVVIAALFVPPVYLLSLLAALTSRLKQIATLGKLLAIGLVCLAAYFLLASLFSRHSVLGDMFQAITQLLKMIFSGNRDAIMGTATYLLFYSQLCLLLFYLCCHMVSRETDSREIALKVLCLTLILSWLGFVGFMTIQVTGLYDKDTPFVAFVPVYTLLCFVGLMMFFSPMRIPVIVQNRYRDAKGLKRRFYSVFQPGPRGLFRYLILVLGMCGVYAGFMYVAVVNRWVSGSSAWMGIPSTMGYAEIVEKSWQEWTRGVSFLLQIPFFVAFPIGFVSAFFPKVRENVAVQRTLVACSWGFAGAVVAFYAVWGRMHHKAYVELLEGLALFASPISSLLVTGETQSTMSLPIGTILRCAMGVLGLYLMHGILRRRTREEAALEPAGSTVSSLVDTGAPA